MLKRILLAATVVSALALSGCLFIKAPPTGVVEGYVTDHLSGEPVVGAFVRAWPLDAEPPRYTVITDYFSPTAVTDDKGYYRLVLPKDVPDGLYVVEVRKEGHATSRVERVKVTSTTRLDIVQKPVFNPHWSLEPPKVTVTGVTEGMTIPGPITVAIEARADNDIHLIYAAFGKMPGAAFLTAPRVIYMNTYTTGTFTIDPADYGVSGDTTFEVVVYDQNDNRTHVIWRVYVTPGAAGPVRPPRVPTANILVDPVHGVLIPARTALAVTLSKKVEFFGEPLEPSAAPPGGNLYVELRWLRSLDDLPPVTGDGYRIYRKLDGEVDFRLLYTVDASGAGAYLYRDSTPDLKVGRMATYRITYFCGPLESAPLEASATPLPSWDVRLVSPPDEAKEVALFPTFTWAPTQVVGTTQFYRVWLWDTPHGGWAVIIRPPLNATSVTYPGIPGTPFERLQPHRTYQWQVDGALGIDLGANAVSVAINEFTRVFPWLAPWENFTFTTGDW